MFYLLVFTYSLILVQLSEVELANEPGIHTVKVTFHVLPPKGLISK